MNRTASDSFCYFILLIKRTGIEERCLLIRCNFIIHHLSSVLTDGNKKAQKKRLFRRNPLDSHICLYGAKAHPLFYFFIQALKGVAIHSLLLKRRLLICATEGDH